MAWELQKVENQRLELVNKYINKEETMTDLCKRFKISTKTGYKWHARFLESGAEGLKDQSKAPHNPHTLYSQEQIQTAIEMKLKYRKWGPEKILAKLKELEPEISWPGATRLYEIFKEHHLVKSRKLRKRVPVTHPLGELNNCNDVWMADFKGWFLTGDNSKCEPLTITDGFSRYLIRCEHLRYKSHEYVWPIFEEAFRDYGLPNRIRTDNGPPFGSVGVGRLTPLSAKLIKAGVMPEWINPGHPEENGRHERFHLTLKEAVAEPPSETLKEQIKSMKFFEEEYNFERPHAALNQKTPASCYRPSIKVWDGVLRAPEYDESKMLIRKVGQSGCIWLRQKEHYLGKTLTGEYVGLEENDQNEMNIFYGPVLLGTIDLTMNVLKRKEVKKRIKRRRR